MTGNEQCCGCYQTAVSEWLISIWSSYPQTIKLDIISCFSRYWRISPLFKNEQHLYSYFKMISIYILKIILYHVYFVHCSHFEITNSFRSSEIFHHSFCNIQQMFIVCKPTHCQGPNLAIFQDKFINNVK